MAVSHCISFLYLSFCGESYIFCILYEHFENRPTLLYYIHSQFFNDYLFINFVKSFCLQDRLDFLLAQENSWLTYLV